MAWGFNEFGELGNGLYTGPDACPTGGFYCEPTPVAVSGVANAVAIASGSVDSLALLANGTVMAWGSDVSGELGSALGLPNGNASPCPNPNSGDQCSSAPVTILDASSSPLSNVTAIAAGSGAFTDSDFNLALLSNGTVDAWGDNEEDQLGTPAVAGGPTAGCGPNFGESCSNVPLQVTGLSSVIAIASQGGAGPYGLALAGPVTFVGNISCSLTGTMTFTPPIPSSGTTGVKFKGKNNHCKGVGSPPASLTQGGETLKKSTDTFSTTLPAPNTCTALSSEIAPSITMTIQWIGTSPIAPTVITFPPGTVVVGTHINIIYAIPNDGVAAGSFPGTAELDLQTALTTAQLLTDCSRPHGIKTLKFVQPNPETPPISVNDNLEIGPNL